MHYKHLQYIYMYLYNTVSVYNTIQIGAFSSIYIIQMYTVNFMVHILWFVFIYLFVIIIRSLLSCVNHWMNGPNNKMHVGSNLTHFRELSYLFREIPFFYVCNSRKTTKFCKSTLNFAKQFSPLDSQNENWPIWRGIKKPFKNKKERLTVFYRGTSHTCLVFLVLCKTWLVQCTLLYSSVH